MKHKRITKNNKLQIDGNYARYFAFLIFSPSFLRFFAPFFSVSEFQNFSVFFVLGRVRSVRRYFLSDPPISLSPHGGERDGDRGAVCHLEFCLGLAIFANSFT